jgi:hypothetical protein
MFNLFITWGKCNGIQLNDQMFLKEISVLSESFLVSGIYEVGVWGGDVVEAFYGFGGCYQGFGEYY